jgi:CRISPR/Cas system CSM-associated protein Csm3 (group 7 of RAMP superfamily)
MIKYVAHIIMEADTPLKVGSNRNDFLQDSPIQRDWNQLPMILGTSLTGVIRKSFDPDVAIGIFGQKNGSKVIVSNALLCDTNMKVHETLLLEKSLFLGLFDILPIREHTAITDKGVTSKGAKFDEEIIFKGTRFKFSIELIDESETTFHTLLNQLSDPSFRIGGGSTKGFGKLKIIEIKTSTFDMRDDTYTQYSSSLNSDLASPYHGVAHENNHYSHYALTLKPDDFFIFASGFGDDNADQTPVYERTIDYAKGGLSDTMVLIPASSIKGALSHRTTYHYNRLTKSFAQTDTTPRTHLSEIFGEAKEKEKGHKGNVLFSDLYQPLYATKTMDHVAIDRFTGGAIEGALFQETTIADNREYHIEILLKNSVEETAQKAFEAALNDLVNGLLPLGGSTTKGHGIFTGTWSKQ